MSDRVFKCRKCHQTADLATLVPELQHKLGRMLTDEEYATLHQGWWHTCQESVFNEERRASQALMSYDWRTGRPR